MARALPLWPLVLFGILEPFALVWGSYVVFTDPQAYVDLQAPVSRPTPISPGALSITAQLGNVFLLLAGLGVLCSWTNYPSIARNYLILVGFADMGHIYASYRGMGSQYFWDIGAWNDMAWGNVGTSVFLCLNRFATVSGVFGRLGGVGSRKKRN